MKKYIVDLLANNPLCGIETYNDTLNLSNGNINRIIKKRELTGNEQWNISSTWKGDNTSVFYYFLSDIERTADFSKKYIISDRFIGTNRDELYSGDTDMVAKTGNNAVTIRVSDNIATTLSQFQQWLADLYNNNTPVNIWYVLATAETNTITVPTGLTGIVNGYLTQSGTPTPTAPIYPTANPVTMWANYTPNIYNSGWTTASGQPKKYNGGWT